MGSCSVPQGSLSTPCTVTSFLPKARGKLQPVCTCSSQALHSSTVSILGGSWLSWPSAVLLELSCHLKNHPHPSMLAVLCHSFCHPADPTLPLDPEALCLLLLLLCRSGKPRASQSHLWLQFLFLFWFWVQADMACAVSV